jgi:class 3 adenylate cyclase/pimeloyl-ACP methyl ester carboxylesterase
MTTAPKVQRRLAAILAMDVVGYSRLMGQDEAGTLARIKSLRSETIEPQVAEHGGRIFKTTGDGFLVEFPSPVEAVEAAVAIQEALKVKSSLHPSRAILLRIGINLGDIIVESDGDVFGDGVNVASRLEQIAEPGGVFVSSKVFVEVSDKIPYEFSKRGEQRVKNIGRPISVYSVATKRAANLERQVAHELTQSIAYCRARDGVQLAWAKVGSGPPLMKTANWLNHLEYDWESPVWHHLLERLASEHTLIRYDARGNGMSDRNVAELSLQTWVSDLEAVADAARLTRFPLFGASQGCAVSIAYAVRHPKKVSHLILYGGFALGGRKRSPEERQRREAMTTLMRLGWGSDEPTFRQLFSSQFLPEGTKEQIDAFNELQRRTVSPECAAQYFEVAGDLDVRELLPKVKVPTLVMHVRDDRVCPIEAGRQMAAAIPGARFVAFDGKNHLFLEDETACVQFFDELRRFLLS